MTFLSRPKLDAAIKGVVSARDPRCAVAFWGRGASALFRADVKARIVCNLSAGGTNPHEVRALLRGGHKVRQNDILHAKVYIGGGRAVIGSANLSANGLGFEASEAAHWLEAGVVTRELIAVEAWFEDLWRSPLTRAISEPEIRAAEALWETANVASQCSPRSGISTRVAASCRSSFGTP